MAQSRHIIYHLPIIKNKKVLDRYQDKDDLKYLIEAKSKAEKNKKRHRKNR